MTIRANKVFSHSNYFFFSFFFCFLLFLFSGCFVKKELARKKVIPDKSPDVVFEELKKNELQFEWLSLKADAEASIDGKTNSFKVNMRIRKDSLIWLSVSSIIGVEAIRAEITPDSIKFMDKINSTYFTGDMDSLSEKFDVDADFETLQSLLIGNSIDLKDSTDMKISVDKGDYLLSAIKKRKLKKILRKKERQEKKIEKKEKKHDVEETEKNGDKNDKENDKTDIILQSLWIDAETFKITRISINDLKTNHSLFADYENFLPVENQLVPYLARFRSEGGKRIKIKLEYSKVTLNVPQSVPFSIPEKYEKRY